jgi:hypothetical protein
VEVEVLNGLKLSENRGSKEFGLAEKAKKPWKTALNELFLILKTVSAEWILQTEFVLATGEREATVDWKFAVDEVVAELLLAAVAELVRWY